MEEPISCLPTSKKQLAARRQAASLATAMVEAAAVQCRGGRRRKRDKAEGDFRGFSRRRACAFSKMFLGFGPLVSSSHILLLCFFFHFSYCLFCFSFSFFIYRGLGCLKRICGWEQRYSQRPIIQAILSFYLNCLTTRLI